MECKRLDCHNEFDAQRSTRKYCSRECQNHSKRSAARKTHDVEFIAVDGEGIGSGADHKYVLLGCGTDYISDPDGLSWETIFRFLYSCYERNPDKVFVGFYLGYDFCLWLRHLPYERAMRLLHPTGVASRKRKGSGGNPTPFPVEIRGEKDIWELDTLAGKRIKLKPKGAKHWLYICDAGPFFQSSFLTAIDPASWDNPIVTDEEFRIISEGKENRDSAQLDADMIRYNALENEVMARVMKEYNRGLVSAGVHLSRQQWFGPGQAAQEWLKQQPGLILSKEFDKYVPADVIEAARKTYYGGWFEIFMHGIIPGITWEYDINSAYPWIMSQLPCLMHGEWKTRTGRSHAIPAGGTNPNLVICYAEVTGSAIIGPVPYRDTDGNIRRPLHAKGWYWAHELLAAQRAGLIDYVEITQTWMFYQHCDCPPPLAKLAELYAMRLLVGKDTPLGKALKLIYNSVYGKFAQSIGHPIFGNPVYASLITAGCRTMILDAIATHPGGANAVSMVATDAVFFTSVHPSLRISNRLGDWDCTEKRNLTQFKPGVYWDDKTREGMAQGKAARFKSRGVNSKAFSRTLADVDKRFREWDTSNPYREFPSVEFPLDFAMVSLVQALRWGKWFLAGHVYKDKKVTQDSAPYAKRRMTPERVDKSGASNYDSSMQVTRSFPYFWGDPLNQHNAEETTPYEKRFGQADTEETWSSAEGLTPDHMTLGDVLSEVIHSV